jgi:hypothetical protein
MKLRFARNYFSTIVLSLSSSCITVGLYAQQQAQEPSKSISFHAESTDPPHAASRTTKESVDPKTSQESVQFRNPTLIIDRTHEGNLSARGERIDVEGQVNGNILVIDGDVIIRSSGIVKGDVVLVGSSKLKRENGARVTGSILHFETPHEAGTAIAELPPAPEEPAEAADAPSIPSVAHVFHTSERDWLAAQVFFVIIGSLFALLFLVVAPRASTLAVAAIDYEPLRCFILGIVGLGALAVVGWMNEILFSTVIWAPFGILVSMMSGVVFIFSIVVGIAFVGGMVARRFGWRVPGFFGRAALGFITLALLNCIPVVNFASAFIQMIAFLVGLGGLIVTGFGRGPSWLSSRLSHQSGDRDDLL